MSTYVWAWDLGTITVAVEEGLISPKEPGKIRMEAPAGLVQIDYKQEGKKVTSVKLTNVPAYLHAENLEVECPELGTLKVDVAYGGNYYAIVDLQENFSGIENHTTQQLVPWSRAIREEMNKRYTFEHPDNSKNFRVKPSSLDWRNP